MRIELPPASWAESGHRAEDDAHTLTVAAQPAPDWVRWQLPADPAESSRTSVPVGEPLILTLTF